MDDRDKTKEKLFEEIRLLKTRIADLQDSDDKYKSAEIELQNTKEQLKFEAWGLAKTNEAIKFLYKELDKKNKELQKLDKLKTDFINIASHELRTPLTTIREVISQFLDGILGQTTPEQKKFLSICLGGVDRLKRLVDDLLDVSQIEAGKFKFTREQVEIVSLAKGVSALFHPKAESIGLELRENFCSQAAIAYADKDSIIRVFTNLIGNALRFTNKGYIEILVMDRPTYVECCVSDTGRGISEEDLLRVFGKFEQFGSREGIREKGTGLGLSICKKIIELHKGQIWVESALNKGTKFTFTLPKYTGKENSAEAKENI
ncbi:MAG: HAMP domain-containing sensor histidine kinase [Candidatus Omnitrophota bacterium]